MQRERNESKYMVILSMKFNEIQLKMYSNWKKEKLKEEDRNEVVDYQNKILKNQWYPDKKGVRAIFRNSKWISNLVLTLKKAKIKDQTN